MLPIRCSPDRSLRNTARLRVNSGCSPDVSRLSTCDDGCVNDTIQPSRWQLPRIDRNERWIGGVAAAIAREIGVQPLVIRVSFLVLAVVGGWGLVLYTVCWAVLVVGTPNRISPYNPQPKGATSLHRHLGIAMVVLGLVLALSPFTSEVFQNIIWPIGFILTGALIAWSRGKTEDGGISVVVRVVAGLSVAVGGVIAFAALRFSLVDTLVALIFGLAVVSGIILVAAPSVIRMARDLDGERLERIRSDERARISAHLHDSVLQTLTLIQTNAESADQIRLLARRQERELRSWLYGPSPTTPFGVRLGPALERAAAEVEDAHHVPIDVVAVGDTEDLDPKQIDALIAATREAMSNAAKHSGTSRIDVYAERQNQRIEVFVRDTGAGFDPELIGNDRKGVTESIIARMQRAGGSAVVRTQLGTGTEVELSFPLDGQAAAPSVPQPPSQQGVSR